MTQHTPGPWNYCQESIDPEWWIVTLKGGLVVANVNAHHNQEANARLIAAAPELLAALTALVADFDKSVQTTDPMLVDARAAIAKTTGAP